jgi:hypothetical protein
MLSAVLTIERLSKPGFLLQNRIVNNPDSFTVELPFTDRSRPREQYGVTACLSYLLAYGRPVMLITLPTGSLPISARGSPTHACTEYFELSIKAESRITRLRDNCRLQCQPVSVWGPWPLLQWVGVYTSTSLRYNIELLGYTHSSI